MSMNISQSRPPLAKIERFSPLISCSIILVPIIATTMAAYYAGWTWGIAVIALFTWSDFLLRSANVNFRGRRKKNKVMAPLVVKNISGNAHDPELGWALAPNTTTSNNFTIPSKKLALDYSVTTDAQARRISSTEKKTTAACINFYGCSNTFGWGLNDDETYPWLVQDALSEFTVHNYGVSGYSLYQILLRMEQTIDRDQPKIVVLGFSPGLEARSVSDHHYLRTLSEHGGTPPSCISREKSGGKRSLKRFPLEAYKHLPFSSKSPLLKLIERKLNHILYAGRAKNNAHRATTEHLLLSMENLCKKHGAIFHVQYLVANTGYREFFHKAGFNWAPGPVDLDECDPMGTYTYRLSPFDGHPNAKANREYAATLRTVLSHLLENGRYKPEPGALGTTRRDKSTESEIYPIF